MKHLKDGHLIAYLDGENTQPDVAAHLELCPACAYRLEELRANLKHVDGLLSRLSDSDRVEMAQPAHYRPGSIVATVGGFVAAASIALVLAANLRGGSRPPPAVPEARYFVPLDADGPWSLGAVVRVDVPLSLIDPTAARSDQGTLAVEVIVGDDGRPHAARVVDSQ